MSFELGSDLTIFDWFYRKILSADKYWTALLSNCSTTCLAMIVASIVTTTITWFLTRDEEPNTTNIMVNDADSSIGTTRSATEEFNLLSRKANTGNATKDPSQNNIRNRKGSGLMFTTANTGYTNIDNVILINNGLPDKHSNKFYYSLIVLSNHRWQAIGGF